MAEAEDFSRPILAGEGASDYERYLRTDELLALQKSAGEQAHRDELLFQTVHQASELWLQLAWTEVEEGTSPKDIGRAATKSVVRMVISVLYDAMKLHVTPDEEAINFDQKELVGELAGRFGADQLAERISSCYEVLRWIESGVNEKLIFEQLLFNLASSDRMAV